MVATDPKGDGPDFAIDTRVVDFGQNLPKPEGGAAVTSGDPIPAGLRVGFRTLKGPGDSRVTPMRKPIVILGRVEDVADVVVDDEAASRYHASVSYRGGKFVLTDMGSTNGTFVNRKPVREVELKHGDQIRIGITVLAFEIEKLAP
ncbi:MAG: FHA domain-containing protein [Deltaproteobacteria bacterium]|nr:FHA domain-containing protein [Deltaproteobacteria bacterium]